RKLGVLVTDGVDATLLNALKLAVTKAGGVCEIVAPNVTGVEASDGTFVAADEMIDGGPSVLFDAVAILPGDDGVASLVAESTARDFVADAFAHCKFIAHVDAAMPLFEKAGIADALDEGVVALSAKKDVAAFVALLGELRLWSREPKLKAPAN
ncbi:MAG: catalase HPII, partial [Pseudorhodoplanes sp.]